MADEQIITNIVARADLSSLVSEVHRATASLQNLQQSLSSAGKTVASQVKVINNSFGETLRSTGQFGSHFVTLHSDVEKFGKGLDAGRLKLRDFYSAFQQHAKTSGGLIRDLARQQVMLQNAVMQPLGRNAQGLMQYEVHIPRGLDLIKNKTKLANMELQIMNRAINEGATSLINWGKNTQWAGRQLTVGLTVPIAAFGAAAAKAFREADQELVRLTKVYGDVSGTTAKELGAVRAEITKTSKELATTMGVNFKETISLAADIAATGKTGEDLLGSLKETTRLAVLGEVDRQEAMKATLAIQSAFKQNTDQLSESINFLNAVENQTSTTLNDLVEAIPKAGPVIKGLGGSIQDLALYLTAMREGGINASEGANALKSALASLINPTDVAVKKFEGFGIDLLGIVKNNAGDTTATLFALQAALDKLDPLSKQQAIEQLFGKFQFSRLNALFENLGKQGSQTLQVLDLMKASAGDLEELAGRELSAVTDSASGQYRRAIESLKAEMSTLGEEFLDIGTKFINIVTKLLKFLNRLPDPVKKLITAFAGFTAIAGPIIMLTGVLANFAGYILKGATNLKSLFAGSKGWKMLTPEIIAAQHAAKTLGDTFYSDAQAAAILEQALRNLVDEFNLLQTAVNNGNISVRPAISTLAGSTLMPGGSGRYVDPTHPLVGEEGTRAFSHINPRKSGFASGGIFGVVPGAIPVNQRIGAAPQIYMHDRLPNIEGLTSIGGVSTGIVSQEAAKFHALMGTLSMRTQQEVEVIKKTVALGGTINSDLLNTYDDLLPITSKFATKAANESAAIVAELRAAKITVDQARARILALNAQIDAEMTAELAQYAALRGLPFDPRKAPLIDQPATDPSGKYNLRDMFKRGSSRGVLEEFGRLRGIRTYGAPYSIEVTRLPKFNDGGKVFYNDGDQVPGPNVNADVVPAMLTPGEFVIRKDVAQQDPDGMRALNEGRAMVVPVQNRFAGGAIQRILSGLTQWNPNIARGARRFYDTGASGSRSSNSPRVFDPGVAYGPTPYHALYRRSGSAWDSSIRFGERNQNEVLGHVITSRFLRSLSGFPMQGSSRILTGAQIQQRFGTMPGGATASKKYQLLPDNLITITKDFNAALRNGSATGNMWLQSSRRPEHLISLISHLTNSGVPYKVAYRAASRTLGRVNKAMTKLGDKPLSETKWGNIVDDAMSREISALYSSYQKAAQHSFNRGGRVGRTRAGGTVRRGRRFYGDNQRPGYTVTDRRASQATMGIGGTPIYPTPIVTPPSTSYRPRISDRLRMSGYLPGPTSMPLNIQNGNVVPGPGPKSMGMGRMLGYGMVGGLGGSMVGSSFGSMGSIVGGIAGSFLPQIIMGLKAASTSAGGLFKILKSLTIPGLVITAITLIVKGLISWKKSAEEAGKANRLAFGGTEDSFSSVGIKKYKEMSDRIKDINEKLELHRAKVKSTYQSYTRTGTPGLTLTIKELRDAIKNAKENQQDYVEAFNNIDSGRVVEYAAQIKAQFVAMGMSAQEATNQIYAIIRASEKAGQALAAITSKDFTSISDSVSGISMLIKALKNELESEDFNAEEFNRGLDTLLNSIIIYKDALVGTKDENENILDQADALELTMEKISKMKGAQKEISEDNLEALKNENIIYSAILGAAETIESITAKIMLYQAGFGEIVNLAAMGAEQAAAFAKNLAIVQNVMNSVTEDTSKGSKNPLLPLANIIARVKKEAKDAKDVVAKLKKVDEDYYKNKIDNIQKTIKALQEERAARLKALDVQEQAQTYEVQLSQAQIRYSQAVATGDLALAAQEQLAIEKLVADRQRQLTRDKINDTYDTKIDKLEKRIEDLQKELKQAQDSYNAKTANATQKAADLAQLESYRDRLEEIALRNFGKNIMSRADAQEISTIFAEMLDEDSPIEVQTAARSMRSAYGQGDSVYQMGWAQGLVNALNKQVGGNAQFKSSVDAFAAAVALFAGATQKPLDDKNIKGGSAGGVPVYQTNVKALEDADITPIKGTQFSTTSGKRYEVTSVNGDRVTVKRLASGGQVQYYGPGGGVSGPGTSTSDSIPAYLSDGEYVIRAAAVDHYGKETFDALNAKKLKGGGSVNYSSAPHAMGMAAGASSKGLNALQMYALASLGITEKVLGIHNPLMHKLMTSDLVRRVSEIIRGSGTKGDYANLAMAAIPFAGPGKVAKAAIEAPKASTFESLLSSKIELPFTGNPVKMKDTLHMPGFASSKSLEEFLSSRMFHGGNLEQGILDTARSGGSGGWLGGKFFATDDITTASMFGSELLSRGKTSNLYEIFAKLKPSEVIDLRHNAPSIFSQNPDAYKALVSAALNNPSKLALPGRKFEHYQHLLRALKAEGTAGEVVAETTSRLNPYAWFNLANVLKDVGVKGIVNRGGWLGKITANSRNTYANVLEDKGYDILSLFEGAGVGFKKISDFSKRPFDIMKMAMGGYAGEIRKFHDWNGAVPGGYGQEVGAILRAGTEGVYDTDYINSLRNGTMNQAAAVGSPTVVQIKNTYNIPENMSKEDIGRYIVDLQRKDLARLGLPRSNS